MASNVTVVGIGAEGWDGMTSTAHDALRRADVVFGSERQVDSIKEHVSAATRTWPSPLLPALRELITEQDGCVCVLASGDPMWHGIGSTITRLLGPVEVIPHPSSVSYACARLGWPVDDVEVVTAVGRPIEELHPAVQPGRRVLVLVSEPDGAARVAALLRARGFADSKVTVLTRLAADDEARAEGSAQTWDEFHDPLAIVAVECSPDGPALSRTPGLPDDAFESDGQLTKREIRALTLAQLVPLRGQLLWDVGAGSGSVGIEWMRTHPSCRAFAVEPRADRRERIARNALALGVPGLRIVGGAAPEALAELSAPDAVFVGGGVSVPGVLEAAWAALRDGGRLVANGVTIETETLLARWHAQHGGSLIRLSVQRAEPVGGFTGWRPAMPITQWAVTK